MTQKQPIDNIKEIKNVYSVSFFGMKFATMYLQPATTLLENGFKFIDCNILHDDSEFNISQCVLKATEGFLNNILIYINIQVSSC